jgi:hypothetical protein
MTCDRSVVSPGTPLSSTNRTDYQHNWNIVESGVKHHEPKQKPIRHTSFRWQHNNKASTFTQKDLLTINCNFITDIYLLPYFYHSLNYDVTRAIGDTLTK